MYTVLLLIGLFLAKGDANDCVPRKFEGDSVVCVCNATYCDTTPLNNPVVPETGSFYWYVSSKDGLRLKFSKGTFNDSSSSGVNLILDSTSRFQTIHGFGGSFTDSAGLNIKKLSPETQDQLLRSYFCPKEGSGYTLGRVPIGGSDFSTRPYTYDDFSNDKNLEHFALQMEDYDYKIPLMKKAREMNPEIRYVSAAWTAPPWMKTNDNYTGFGFLKDEYYQTFADYLVKFLDEYEKNGVEIWGISTGNEPANAFFPFYINKMGWTPTTVAKWVAENIGPTIAKSQHNRTVLLALDDQRFNLPWYIDIMFRNKETEKYIAGIAVHWYWDTYTSISRIDRTHEKHPDKFIIMTEACAGSAVWANPKVLLGSWSRGEQYILNIIEDLNHWITGWIDWNLALDKTGGPNWVKNFVDSPIIVNPETDEFFKQPMYYALKHFSKFIKPGAVRISISDTNNIKSVAVATPTKEIVIVLYNMKHMAQTITINDLQRGKMTLELPPYSLHTIIYSQ